jgi:hypothetical protein
MKRNGGAVAVNLHDEVNGKGESAAGIESGPATYEVTVQGVAPMLFHRWDCAAVDAKSKAKKNSKEKKTDNLESYVYRHDNGTLGVPAENFRGALLNAAKSKADPRSPRKSARDLMNAILLVTPMIASLGVKTWDYEDSRRVTIQRNGITRIRPAMREGWQLKFHINILDTSYADEPFVHDLVSSAGRFCGLCDHRPQFGRFNVIGFKRLL